MRVVYLDHVARLSGGELALLGLIRAVRKEIEPLVVLGEEGPLAVRLREEGIEVEVMPLQPRLRDMRKESVNVGGLDVQAISSLPVYVLRLARRLRKLQPDLVHTNSLKSALYGGLAGRLARVPVVWHLRDRVSGDYLPPTAIRLVRLAARVLPAVVVANSEATLATLPQARLGTVVYNSVAPPPVVVAPARRPTVGMVGRLAPWKGQEVFLDAFAAAFRGGPVRGRIIGAALFGEERYEMQLRQHAEELGIASQVEFRGFREPIWQELVELDVLAHCSTVTEPFGQVVLEGMAAGLPVVATDGGGPAELVTDGVDGLLVAPNDPRALAVALGRLMADPDLRRNMGDAARERSQAFSPERAAARMLEIYVSLTRAG